MNLSSPEMKAMFNFWRVNKAASIAAFTAGELTSFQKQSFRVLAEALANEGYLWQFHSRGQGYSDIQLCAFARMQGAQIVLHPHGPYWSGMEPVFRGTGLPPIVRDPAATAAFDTVDDASLVLFFLPSTSILTDPTGAAIESAAAYQRARSRKGVLTVLPEEISPLR